MKRNIQGKYVETKTLGEVVRAFVPVALPPAPFIEVSSELRQKFNQCLTLLGQLNATQHVLPNASLFLDFHVRKEAVLSSKIEGTQSSLSDLLLFDTDEVGDKMREDVHEVSNYVAALEHGLQRLESLPLSGRFIREIHEKLMRRGRGSNKQPGVFRTSQNWIGGTRPGNAVFVPPPPHEIGELIKGLEVFLHNPHASIEPLLKAALAHVQFETIHPFLDGNGRVGRLLITLILQEQQVLTQPLLYCSLYFKLHRQRYYDLLDIVRTEGDWEQWLDFFADAVIYTARQSVESITRILALIEQDRARIASLERAGSVLSVYEVLIRQPIATAEYLARQAEFSMPTIYKVLRRLSALDIVHEQTGRLRKRVFSYHKYMEILEAETF